jgi:hypothetical protein
MGTSFIQINSFKILCFFRIGNIYTANRISFGLAFPHRRVLVRGTGAALGSSLPLSSVPSASSSSSSSVRIDIDSNSAGGGGRVLGSSLVVGSGGQSVVSSSRVAATSTATTSAAASAKSEAADPAFPQAQDEGDGVGFTYR